ncbi:MAG TPA: hypothetical protein PL141_03480 [Thermoflexales bacterium]|nr:hypothetical protein [Thermoflexales bacterium]
MPKNFTAQMDKHVKNKHLSFTAEAQRRREFSFSQRLRASAVKDKKSKSASSFVRTAFQEIRQNFYFLSLISSCLVILAAFAVYAGVLRLVLLHDDAVNLQFLESQNIVSLFLTGTLGGATGRPAANLFWVLTRDLFGWFNPAIIHFWNLAFHVLNTALVLGLAKTLGQRMGFRSAAFPITSGLIFALFPWSYQDVIWAGSIFHPVMMFFGLAAVLIALRAPNRAWLAAPLIVLAGLSHEAGFIFAGLMALAPAALSLLRGKGVGAKQPLLVGVLCGAFLIALRFVSLQNSPTSDGASLLAAPAQMAQNAWPNTVYFMQAMALWLTAWLRPIIGLPDQRSAIIAACFALVVIGAILLTRKAARKLVVMGLGWWAFVSLPFILTLPAVYVIQGPRLLYAASAGIAILCGALFSSLISYFSSKKFLAMALAAFLALNLIWSAGFILDRLRETERMTPVMQTLDADLRQSDPAAKALFINLPWWNAPNTSGFLIGAEGMPIYQHGDTQGWEWLYAYARTARETKIVYHPISETRDPNWNYGHYGEQVDDNGLRAAILAADETFKFEYAPPGLRVWRIARLLRGADSIPNAYTLVGPDAKILMAAPPARACGGKITAQITWLSVVPVSSPTGIFAHGFNAQDQQVVAADRDLFDGYLPIDLLPQKVAATETREITTDKPIASLHVGLYVRDGVKKFAAFAPNGKRVDGDEIIIPVEQNCLEKP